MSFGEFALMAFMALGAGACMSNGLGAWMQRKWLNVALWWLLGFWLLLHLFGTDWSTYTDAVR